VEKGGGLVYDERQPAGRQLRPGFFFGGENNELDPSSSIQRGVRRGSEALSGGGGSGSD
jgi:hypothetical protein